MKAGGQARLERQWRVHTRPIAALAGTLCHPGSHALTRGEPLSCVWHGLRAGGGRGFPGRIQDPPPRG